MEEEEYCRAMTKATGGHVAADQIPVYWSLDFKPLALEMDI